jgi:2-keto-4-pentenoate hydratase/2-oxohepta-3-ene-1,7-dioic acid hydratase in catechol pathway
LVTNQNVTHYCRYIDGGQASYGILEGDTIRQLDGFYAKGGKPTGKTVKLADVKLTLPVDRADVRKVIGVEYNYDGTGNQPFHAKHPSFYPKFHTSLAANGAEVELPSEVEDPMMGATMVLMIGKGGRNISLADAASQVFAIAVGNDVTDMKGYGRGGGLFSVDRMLGKANDTWQPLGDTFVSGVDYSNLSLTGKLNGQVAQDSSTSKMITSVPKLIHYASHYITLEPGDLLITGHPPSAKGLRTIKPGDTMEVTLEGVGTISNPVVALKGGIRDPWWMKVFEEAAALPDNAADVAAAKGPMEG